MTDPNAVLAVMKRISNEEFIKKCRELDSGTCTLDEQCAMLFDDTINRLEATKAENKRLREYAIHKPSCLTMMNMFKGQNEKCNCGYEQALKDPDEETNSTGND